MVSRANVALGIEAQGFAAACGLQPLATRLARSLAGMSDDPFVTHRSLLFTVAYEMLGSAADAEDVVQETWVRWADVDQAEVREPRAYLVRIVTRQALNRLRTLARRREDYVGEWLPEPLLTVPDVAQDVELAESVSIAMLTVLETLGPVERAVFVLREVFDVPVRRDRGGGRQERGGGAADRPPRTRARHRARPRMSVSRAEQEAAVERFRAALTTGDLQGLLDVLAPDSCWSPTAAAWSRRRSARCPGRKTVARQLARFAEFAAGARGRDHVAQRRARAADRPGGEFDSAISLTVEGGRITRIYAIRNPDKLTGLDRVAVLTR